MLQRGKGEEMLQTFDLQIWNQRAEWQIHSTSSLKDAKADCLNLVLSLKKTGIKDTKKKHASIIENPTFRLSRH